MNEQHYLKQIFKPENFTPEELELILAQYKRIEFKKNGYLISEGDVGNYYYFIELGFARSYAIDTEGNDVTTKFYTSNDIVIDWNSYFLKTPCREFIQAVTKVTAHKIYFADFMKLFKIEAFREVGRTRLVKNYFELKNHTLSMITDQAKDRYLNLVDQHSEIVNNVPLKYIASYLGVTDTSLSRIRKDIFNQKK